MTGETGPPAGGQHRRPAGHRPAGPATASPWAMPRRWTGPRDRGGATAEFAVVLPAVAMMLVVVLVAGAAVLTQVRVADAARAGARAAALGESESEIVALAHRIAGPDAQVDLRMDGDLLLVEVSRRVPGPLQLADLEASAQARAMPEPGEA